jgi:hypothetical protein
LLVLEVDGFVVYAETAERRGRVFTLRNATVTLPPGAERTIALGH